MVALIGGGERPKFSQNTLVVYDAAASEPVMDITFGSPLRKVVTDQIHHKNEGAIKIYIFTIIKEYSYDKRHPYWYFD